MTNEAEKPVAPESLVYQLAEGAIAQLVVALEQAGVPQGVTADAMLAFVLRCGVAAPDEWLAKLFAASVFIADKTTGKDG